MNRIMHIVAVTMMIEPGNFIVSSAKCFTAILILIIFPMFTKAQQKDFQAWPSIQVNAEVIDKLKFHIEEELRLHENLSLFNRQINDAGVSYQFNSFLRAGIHYRLEADWKNARQYEWRNGIYGDIYLKHEIKRMTLKYRFRAQSSKIERNSENRLFDGFRHRHKLSAEYNIKGIPLFPYIESELFVDYSPESKSVIKGLRTWLGIDYAIKNMHTVSLKYGIDKEINTPDPLKAYILSLGYTLDIDLVSGK